jgi:hypothetical protein
MVTPGNQRKNDQMKTNQAIQDAAHMLVSAQCDIIQTKRIHITTWVGGYYMGKRSAAKFILKHAVERGAKRTVAKAIRFWVDYHKTSSGNQFLSAAA